jgi:hypothetical protein
MVRLGCGDDLDVLRQAIEVSEGRPWSKVRQPLVRREQKETVKRMAMYAAERARDEAARGGEGGQTHD